MFTSYYLLVMIISMLPLLTSYYIHISTCYCLHITFLDQYLWSVFLIILLSKFLYLLIVIIGCYHSAVVAHCGVTFKVMIQIQCYLLLCVMFHMILSFLQRVIYRQFPLCMRSPHLLWFAGQWSHVLAWNKKCNLLIVCKFTFWGIHKTKSI